MVFLRCLINVCWIGFVVLDDGYVDKFCKNRVCILSLFFNKGILYLCRMLFSIVYCFMFLGILIMEIWVYGNFLIEIIII